jgi:hypothetical protein
LEYLQKALEWAYILACLALIWYGVSLVAALWRFARRQLPGRFVFKVLAKFMGAWVFAWGVVWIGILSASP